MTAPINESKTFSPLIKCDTCYMFKEKTYIRNIDQRLMRICKECLDILVRNQQSKTQIKNKKVKMKSPQEVNHQTWDM